MINDKLQGSVATYLRMGGGVVNNQIKKGLLLSLSVKKSFKNRWIFRKNVVVSYTFLVF